MPYKEKLQLSEIDFYLLPDIKNFIEEILDLSEIYGYKVKMPVAYPPKKEYIRSYPTYEDLFASTSIIVPTRENLVKGIYQDEAILKENAQKRLNIISIIKKLGGIQYMTIDEKQLAEREMIISVDAEKLKELFNKLEKIIEQKAKEEAEIERKSNEIYYNKNKKQIELGDKAIQVSGWEDAISKVVFTQQDNENEIDLGEIIQEMTGEIYIKSENSRYMEAVRQAVYRLNKKIKENFNKENCLFFSTRTRKLTLNKNNSKTK